MLKARTGQSAFSRSCSWEQKGGEWKANSSIGRYDNAESNTLGTRAGFGFNKTLEFPCKNCIHAGFTDVRMDVTRLKRELPKLYLL